MTGTEPGDIEAGLKRMTPEDADKTLAQHVKGYAAPKPTNENHASEVPSGFAPRSLFDFARYGYRAAARRIG